jgi:photosystem II stability/assembly factor-like uncharacterized protein
MRVIYLLQPNTARFSNRQTGLFLFLLGLLAVACRTPSPYTADPLARKSEPFDHFSQQRAWPHAQFDWIGWRNQMQAIREYETTAAKGNPCAGNNTPWTLQGPAGIAGRCNTLVVKPGDENTVLAGFASGGIWKSTDGAQNWRPVFDDNLELAIGDLTYDPVNPDIVYAGTGDPNMPSTVQNGNGVFKSTDGGETWAYLGLGEQGVISKVVVDPANPQIIYVAAMGNPYVRTAERGIYKTTDGGASWQKVLFVSNQAGAGDLVMAPGNPQVLYASFWDRIRSNTESIVYGPGARIYKTTNGGQNWTLLGGGLPTGSMGRTGLAISAANPNKLWAVYVDTLSRPGGLFRTLDGGQSWISYDVSALKFAYDDFGWYFGKLRLNPKNDDDVYFLGILLYRKDSLNDKTWSVAARGHADSHDLVFTPSGRGYWANDGGVYRNDFGSETWTRSQNLPVTQFYRTDYNPNQPNAYWAGAQDNGINRGGAATGLNNWQIVFGADGFNCAFDPQNPNNIWIESQNGRVRRSTDGGLNFTAGATCLGTGDRCNWDTPFFRSAHSTNAFYAATYRVYTSADGAVWNANSGDLTDGNVFGDRFHTISALDESPVQAGKLLAGTSDGRVWRRSPEGAWTDLSSGLPKRYVTSVSGSPVSAGRIFTTHSGFRDNEDIPHLHRSDNDGATWVNISGDLPQTPVNDLFILPGHADSVLCAATDLGVYFTINGGKNWRRLGSKMPYVLVNDLEHNPARRELVAATFGRSLWTFPLDSIFQQKGALAVQLSGHFKTEAGAAIEAVEVAAQPAVAVDAAGVFVLENVPGCAPIAITPRLNRLPLNGVTAYDLVLISKHILGLNALGSPFKLIAADANRSGSVTAADVVALRKLILGIDINLKENTSWRFVPKNFVFPDPQNPFQTPFPESIALNPQGQSVAGLDFIGVKTGDVDQTAMPNGAVSAEERVLADWPVYASGGDFSPGSPCVVTVSAGLKNLAGAQFSLRFDPEVLVFEKIEPHAAWLGTGHFNTKRAAEGVLSVCFEDGGFLNTNNEISLENRTINLFDLHFKAQKSGLVERVLKLSDLPTRALAFEPDGSPLRPVLAYDKKAASEHPVVGPNPFGAAGCTLLIPSSGQSDLNIQVFDNQGKMLFETSAKGQNNTQQIHIPGAVFPHAGTFYWVVRDKTNGVARWSGGLVKGK